MLSSPHEQNLLGGGAVTDTELYELYKTSESRAVPIAANTAAKDGITQMLNGDRREGFAKIQRARKWMQLNK